MLVGLFLAWRYTPLADELTTEHIVQWARKLRGISWSPLAVIAAYIPAAFLMFPRPLLTLFAGVAYGPWLGFATAMAGDIAAALATYYAGRMVPDHTLHNLVGDKFKRMSGALRKHGFAAAFAASVAPVAPFPVVGMVAGAASISVWQYVAGIALGMLPGTLATTVFADQIAAALEDPSTINYWVIAGIVVFFAVLMFLMRRWVVRYT